MGDTSQHLNTAGQGKNTHPVPWARYILRKHFQLKFPEQRRVGQLVYIYRLVCLFVHVFLPNRELDRH